MDTSIEHLDEELRALPTLAPSDLQEVLNRWIEEPLFSMSRLEQAWHQATRYHPVEVGLCLLNQVKWSAKDLRSGLGNLLERGLGQHLEPWAQTQANWSTRWVSDLMTQLLGTWCEIGERNPEKAAHIQRSMAWLAPQLPLARLDDWVEDWTNHLYDLADEDNERPGEDKEDVYDEAMEALDHVGPLLTPSVRQRLLATVEHCFLPETVACEQAAQRQRQLENLPVSSASPRRYRS